MITHPIKKAGFWSGTVLVVLGLLYMGLISIMMASGTGFPPAEPFLTIFNVLILFTAVIMVFFWTAIHRVVSAEGKFFSQVSLALIVIFAALTSINRYVGLTVVRQSYTAGNMEGLQWFLPYGWPSVMLALEFLAWGFFFGLACLSLAVVFRKGRLESSISWTLVGTGILSLLAVLGQVLGVSTLSFNPFTFAGVLAWGPGLTTVIILISLWLYRSEETS